MSARATRAPGKRASVVPDAGVPEAGADATASDPTASDLTASDATASDLTALGRAAHARFRRPGPRSRPRPAPIGSLASAATRFVAGISRPVEVRRSLRGPATELVHPAAFADDVAVRPPRWWTPSAAEPTPTALPPRALPTMLRPGSLRGPAPGHMAEGMVASTVPVRRYTDVTAVGPMLTQREREQGAKPPRSTPGQSPGGAGAPVTRSAVATSSRAIAAQRAMTTPAGSPPSAPSTSRTPATAPSWANAASPAARSTPAPLARRIAAAGAGVAGAGVAGAGVAGRTVAAAGAGAAATTVAARPATNVAARPATTFSAAATSSAQAAAAPLEAGDATSFSGVGAARRAAFRSLVAAPAGELAVAPRAVAQASRQVARGPIAGLAARRSTLRGTASRRLAPAQPRAAVAGLPHAGLPHAGLPHAGLPHAGSAVTPIRPAAVTGAPRPAAGAVAAATRQATQDSALAPARVEATAAVARIGTATPAPPATATASPAATATAATATAATATAAGSPATAATPTNAEPGSTASNVAASNAATPAAPDAPRPAALAAPAAPAAHTAASETGSDQSTARRSIVGARPIAGVAPTAQPGETAHTVLAPSLFASRAPGLPRVLGTAVTPRVSSVAGSVARSMVAPRARHVAALAVVNAAHGSPADSRAGQPAQSRPGATAPSRASHPTPPNHPPARDRHDASIDRRLSGPRDPRRPASSDARIARAGGGIAPGAAGHALRRATSDRSPFAATPTPRVSRSVLGRPPVTRSFPATAGATWIAAATAQHDLPARPSARVATAGGNLGATGPVAAAGPAASIAISPPRAVNRWTEPVPRSITRSTDIAARPVGSTRPGRGATPAVSPPTQANAVGATPATTPNVARSTPNVARSTPFAGARSLVASRRPIVMPPRGAGASLQRAEAKQERGTMTPTSGEGAVRRSLLDSTAGLFAARAATAATPTVASSGMSGGEPTLVYRMPMIGSHRARPSAPATPAVAATSTTPAASTDIARLPAREFQRLVDAIVDVIEQRVVDELERRGRRNPGVF